MTPAKVATYVILGLLGLVLVSLVMSALFAAIAFVWLLARVIFVLVILGVVGFVGYKAYSLVSGLLPGSESTPDRASSTGGLTGSDDSMESTDSVDDLKERYTSGNITEAEFERKLERVLDDREYDDIDRELQRDRV